MSPAELLRRYLDHLQGSASRSGLASARQWLGLFCEGCPADSAAELSAEHVAGFRRRLLWQPGKRGHLYSQNTVYHALRTLRSWLRWAHSRRLLLVDPAEDLVLPRPPRALARVLTVEQVQRLLETCAGDNVLDLRDAALIDTLYTTGVRAAECQGLELTDLDLATGQLQVHGKGGRDRVVPTGKALAETLERYLEQSRPQLAGELQSPALFLVQGGRRLSYPSLGAIVRKRARQAGLGPVSPHALRHACATHLLSNGADLRSIQELLGHKRVTSTEVYTLLRPAELVREHRRTHPRAKRQDPPEL